ncbi:hypothetical protein HanRHA438_Chr09g0410531 [Helianthus annuus]|uniref:Uncharacterized protein n=1 Tax=Helianthus annuus TaxID=4232 RepID=A0A9K3I7B0_HELAN|nr:hypothetical protein HanXRQr2_Chr09g0398751 [Helianthus annuus]KAJ0526800.1 hypothetical protein HanHA300_Chr09g0327181 [Helianthus annuus]KAJ0535337.1 hypothetical protein HanIR_Chr09g0429601 [Helianthus annuus]KAJ0543196.1 hypothetical protein HanHA89_Chr09g0348111 [Helianthus annuus]KAJ0708247.1 hypothetical protein HanLR1_Chr09g0327401 [Helianthus annuus]
MTAVASLSQLVQKPTVTVSPKTGLEVTLSGSASTGSPPTTLSPTLLNINCSCQTARDDPYEVQLTIPVEGYDPIQFSLTKMRGNVQFFYLPPFLRCKSTFDGSFNLMNDFS